LGNELLGERELNESFLLKGFNEWLSEEHSMNNLLNNWVHEWAEWIIDKRKCMCDCL